MKDILSVQDKYKLPTPEDRAVLRSKVRSPNTGRRLLRSLFYEAVEQSVIENDVSEPLFTLKDANVIFKGKFYWSLKNIYMSYDHAPGFEYEFAKDIFGDWEHWDMLANSSDKIKVYIDQWRDELAIKLQAKAIKSMLKTAISEGSKGIPAAKFLADRGWEVKRGRPSKEEVTRERKIAAGVSRDVAEDMERLGLTVISKEN